MNKQEKWIYLIIGIGCGILLSGMVMIALSLEYGKTYTNVMNQHAIEKKELQQEIKGYQQTMKDYKQEIDDTHNNKNNPYEVQEVYKKVQIPSSTTSNQIALFLEEQGIVDEADAFQEFLVQKGKTRKLRTGVKYFPLHGNYDEILQVLLGN